MEQFTKLVEFRQAIYEQGLTKARDAQFELLDALLLSPPIRSFPELALSPAFRYRWPSAYAAIESGQQDQEWLEAYASQQVPTTGPQVFPLDGTAWPHPQAKTLADRQYVHSPTPAVDGGSVVVGHPYSVLAWVPDPGRSWAPPISIRGICSHETDVQVGVAQVKRLCRNRRRQIARRLHIIVADGKYGNHRFLAPL
jgi:hypothetical protein